MRNSTFFPRILRNNAFYARIDGLDAQLRRRDEVINLVLSGQMIRAIKVYREDTGASLADAKAAVERMEQRMRLSPLRDQVTIESPTVVSLDADALRSEVESLIGQRKQIHAIKLYRERTGVGLRVAKETVDQIARDMQLRDPSFEQSSASSAEVSWRTALYPGDDIRSLILKGEKIKAIVLYRKQTGLGLREAKHAIDELDFSLRFGPKDAF